MQGHRRFTLNFALVSALFAATGCVDQVASSDEAAAADQVAQEAMQIQAALNQDNGGLTRTNEQPAFNDPEVLATTALNENFTDQNQLNTDAADGPNAQRFHLFLMWGHLPADNLTTQAPEPKYANWIGSVSTDRGRIGLRRVLKFDHHDYVEPRVSMQEISFVSRTLPAVDGLLLQVLAPPDAVLVFDTVSLETKIPLANLTDGGQGYVSLGDGANGFVYSGYVSAGQCGQGFLFGHWKDMPIWDVGRFRGRVVSRIGAPLGFVRGHYGYSSELDDDVFFGKYINEQGAFKGLLGGTYENGKLAGRWGTVDDDHGKLLGYYFPGNGGGRGRFLGQWVEGCNTTTDANSTGTNADNTSGGSNTAGNG